MTKCIVCKLQYVLNDHLFMHRLKYLDVRSRKLDTSVYGNPRQAPNTTQAKLVKKDGYEHAYDLAKYVSQI